MSVNMYEYHKVYESVLRSGNPVKATTLAGWLERATLTRGALLLAKEQYRKDVQQMRDRYSTKVFQEKRTAADAEYKVLVDVAKQRVSDDLEAVLASKRSAFDHANDPPSEATVRLLQVLNMRDSLTAEELAAVSGKVEHNLNALRVLKDIAHRHGLSFPDVGSPGEFERLMAQTESYIRDRLDAFDLTEEEINRSGKTADAEFWNHSNDQRSRHWAMFNPLDFAGFTSQQVTAANDAARNIPWSPDTNSAVQSGKALSDNPSDVWSEVSVRVPVRVDQLARQFKTTAAAIRGANPDRLITDSTVLYGGDVILVPSTRYSVRTDSGDAFIAPSDVRPVMAPAKTAEAVISPDLPGPDPARVREFLRRETAADALDAED